MKENLPIPNDFKVMSYDKEWFDEHSNICTVFYFNPEEHDVAEIASWAEQIQKFTGSLTIMPLPNDFSKLQFLTMAQMIELQQRLDVALKRIKENNCE